MVATEPDCASIQESMIELLTNQEVGAFATLSPDGFPSVSAMHIAADGLRVYLHTLTQHRKYREMLQDARVSYSVWHLPPGGFSERRQLRSIQVNGHAALVTEQAEVERAVEVSKQQFPWLGDSRMYDRLTAPGKRPQQAFFRIDPLVAVWADHRVRQNWRAIVTFTPDGRTVSDKRPYPDTDVVQ